MIVVDADESFAEMLKKTFQYNLLIPAHAASRVNHKVIINGGFHRYLNKVQKINSSYKGSLYQWLKGVFLALYSWNAGPFDGTNITPSEADINIEFPFTIELSPAKSREFIRTASLEPL